MLSCLGPLSVSYQSRKIAECSQSFADTDDPLKWHSIDSIQRFSNITEMRSSVVKRLRNEILVHKTLFHYLHPSFPVLGKTLSHRSPRLSSLDQFIAYCWLRHKYCDVIRYSKILDLNGAANVGRSPFSVSRMHSRSDTTKWLLEEDRERGQCLVADEEVSDVREETI